jgi:hypothetical protein
MRHVISVLATLGVAIGCSSVGRTQVALNAVQIPIKPICKDMFYGPDFVNADRTVQKTPRPDYVPWDPSRAKPLTFADPRTQTTFYVESDGRHLAAIHADGTLLWVRNPFEDHPANALKGVLGLCPYRTPRPVIARIEATEITTDTLTRILQSAGMNPTNKFITVTFDSSQFGLVDETTGDFFFLGQN